MKIISYTLIGAIMFFALAFGLNNLRLFNLKFWGTKYQNARTEIFQETKAYTHGTIRDIENLCLDALKIESETHRGAIKSTIQHRVSAFNKDLPYHVQKCINQL